MHAAWPQALHADQDEMPDKEDQYMLPADTEDDLYQQLEKQGLRTIPADEIK